MTKIGLSNETLKLKIDTGAEVTVIPETCYDKHRDGQLLPSDRVLTVPAQQTLDVLDQFQGRFEKDRKKPFRTYM